MNNIVFLVYVKHYTGSRFLDTCWLEKESADVRVIQLTSSFRASNPDNVYSAFVLEAVLQNVELIKQPKTEGEGARESL